MKVAFAVLGMLISSALFAEDNSFFVGPKVGSVLISDEGALVNLDDGSLAGFIAGYNFSGGVGVEFEAVSSEHDLKNGIVSSLDFETKALYLSLRSAGSGYFKVKAGILSEEISSSVVSVDDTGLSFGAGVGVNLGQVSLEAEYIIIEQDASSVGVSLLLNF